ncbi:MAG: ParB N-terminal domain-containing protein, partial [Pseudomonadota bacterium]
MTNQSTIPNDAAIIYASLDQLYLHALNPRQNVAQQDVETLADSIKTCGLLQNLGGIQDDDGKIGIVSGGRRLRALVFLAETLPDFAGATSIPVLLARDLEQAEFWANAENTAREALDPADEIRAYGRMAETNADAEAIASAFGVTVAHVKGRLKLANLPDAALDALKAKTINLSAAQKMTTAQDEKLVLEALQAIAEGRLSNVSQLDHFLHPKAAKATDRRAVFVGVEAYEAGGGKITRDLFSEDVFFEDQDVLDEAFAAQLAEAAEQVRVSDGWAWVETHSEAYLGWNFIEDQKFARVYPVEGVLSDDQMERYEDLCEMADNDVLNADGEDELACPHVILEGAFTDAQKSHAGCVVYVDQSGGLKVEAGLVRPED